MLVEITACADRAHAIDDEDEWEAGAKSKYGFARFQEIEMTENEAFSIIEAARKLASEEKLTAKTEVNYTKIATRLQEQFGEAFHEGGPAMWLEALDAYSTQDATFRMYKAATCWYLRQRLRDQLQVQDRFQRQYRKLIAAGRKQVAADCLSFWLVLVARIKDLSDEYEAVRIHPRNPPKDLLARQSVDKSKRHDLRKIRAKFKDWDRRMITGSVGTRYHDAVQALKITGCRSEELRSGIEVQLEPNGEVSFNINGAKVDRLRGQAWRKLIFPLSEIPEAWQDRLQQTGDFTIGISSTDEQRGYLHRLSEKCLPGVPYASAYVLNP